ncbi:MAG TPA: serine hydrolase domain-containing protein [Bryobacteraceae bacterium]|nr:serine hydrolase domain-containing protein [Bryobacteraceae bacterium]
MTRRTLLFSGVALALRQGKLDEATRMIEAQTKSGDVAAASLHVQSGKDIMSRAFGKAQDPKAVFLLASITKPMTCTAVMLLSDRKELSIDDPVRKYVPEFFSGDRDRVLIRHLLSHSSGLPDMLPENDALRKKHATLKHFVEETCRTPLLFPPGTKVKYQSMGILLAAEIVERITKRPLPAFLQAEVFKPLGMKQTSLGLGNKKIEDTMPSQVTADPDWNWNSAYWRNLGAPWGGAFAPASDVARFLQYFVKPEPPVLKPETAARMITDQNKGLNQPYGIGWALNESKFGKGCSAKAYGHGGSTGTLCWLDPERDLSFVLLTTKPAAQSQKTLITPVSDLVSEAV